MFSKTESDIQMVDMPPVPPPTWGYMPSQNSLLERSQSELSTTSRRTVQLNTQYFSQAQRWLSIMPASAALLLSGVNVVSAKYDFFRDLLQPGFPIACPVLLFIVGVAALVVGCRTDLERVDLAHSSFHDPEEYEEKGLRRKVSCVRTFLHSLTPGGRLFHQKVQFLQAVGILNMALVLQTSLETGQLRRYIVSQALVILGNAICFPLLFTRPHPMYHTVGVMFMDIAKDAVFGAALPVCMGLELGLSAIIKRKELERETVPDDNYIRFLIVANRFVPAERRDLVQLLIPYITLTLRLGDVRKARKLLNLGGLPSAGWSVLHKRVATILYFIFGFGLFILCMWRCFLYGRCMDSKDLKWGDGCLQQSYYTMETCRCIYFHYKDKIANGHFINQTLELEDMESMLTHSKQALRILSIWGWQNETFPSLYRNTNLMWVFFHMGGLQTLPSLQPNIKLERLVIRDNLLLIVPSIVNLTKLKWLDVQNNSVAKIPDLDTNENLERLMISENYLQQLPNLTNLKHLKKLRALKNRLHTVPRLDGNPDLSVLDLSSNMLKELPSFQGNSKMKELKVSENMLKTLPSSLSSLTKLKELDVANNRLEYIESFESNKELWNLNVSGNRLSKLPELKLYNLTVVDVCDNRFPDPPTVRLGKKSSNNWYCLCCKYPLVAFEE